MQLGCPEDDATGITACWPFRRRACLHPDPHAAPVRMHARCMCNAGYTADMGINPILLWNGVETSNPQAVVSLVHACAAGRTACTRLAG